MIRFLLPADRCRVVDHAGRVPDCGGVHHVSQRPNGSVACGEAEVAAGFRAVSIAVEVDDDAESPFTGTASRFVPVCEACGTRFLREGGL